MDRRFQAKGTQAAPSISLGFVSAGTLHRHPTARSRGVGDRLEQGHAFVRHLDAEDIGR